VRSLKKDQVTVVFGVPCGMVWYGTVLSGVVAGGDAQPHD